MLSSFLLNKFTSEPISHYSNVHLKSSFNLSLETCMPDFDSIRELTNSKRYYTASNPILSENGSSESCLALELPETNGNEGPEIRALTQQDVEEQNKSFIAPLTKQLKVLIQLI